MTRRVVHTGRGDVTGQQLELASSPLPHLSRAGDDAGDTDRECLETALYPVSTLPRTEGVRAVPDDRDIMDRNRSPETRF